MGKYCWLYVISFFSNIDILWILLSHNIVFPISYTYPCLSISLYHDSDIYIYISIYISIYIYINLYINISIYISIYIISCLSSISNSIGLIYPWDILSGSSSSCSSNCAWKLRLASTMSSTSKTSKSLRLESFGRTWQTERWWFIVITLW